MPEKCEKALGARRPWRETSVRCAPHGEICAPKFGFPFAASFSLQHSILQFKRAHTQLLSLVSTLYVASVIDHAIQC